MTTLVVRKVIKGGKIKLKLVPVVPRGISEGVLKLERVQVICPACGQQVEAVAGDGRVKGYCAVAKQYVDFLVETQGVPAGNPLTDEHRAKISATKRGKYLTAETRAKLSAASKKLWQDPDYRAKQIATHTGKHSTTETRAKISTALTGNTSKPHTAKTRSKQSAIAKKRWQDPEYRAKQSASHAGKSPTAETRAKVSAVLKTAKVRAKLSASTKKCWQNPEYRAKQSVARMGKHPTAETRAKISAAVTRQHESERRANERPY